MLPAHDMEERLPSLLDGPSSRFMLVLLAWRQRRRDALGVSKIARVRIKKWVLLDRWGK